MKKIVTKANTAKTLMVRAAQTAAVFALVHAPAFAQFQAQVQNKLSTVSAVLLGVSGVTATIAAGYVGNKMMFGQAKWPEVSHVALGGMFVAVASAFGAWIVA